MTDVTVGSVWQTDVSWKWASSGPQGNVYAIGFPEWNSNKLFVYFSKSKEVFCQTKDLLESESPKYRIRHSMTDFILNNGVGEFQSKKYATLSVSPAEKF